jgi:hypothetical protein
MRLILITLGFLVAVALCYDARADDRVNVYFPDYNRAPIHITGPKFSSVGFRPCFPFGCGGIGDTVTNPDPNARKPENLTACIYGVDNVLLYQRPGKNCPKEYIDQNQLLMEQR